MKPNTMNQIIKAVKHAREKHPVFAENLHHAVSIAGEEYGELAKAVNENKPQDVEAEALDLIAVCVRLIEQDHLKENKGVWAATEAFFDNDAAMKIYKEDMLKRISELLKEEDKALRSQLKLICDTHHVSPLDVELCYEMTKEGHKMWFKIKDEEGEE